MYKKNAQPNTPNINNNKKTPKIPDRIPSSLQDKKNGTISQFKSKDEQLHLLVKEYLQLNGYNRAYQILRNEKPSIRIKQTVPAKIQPDKSAILSLFDKGLREQFFKQTQKLFNDENSIRLQFELNVYFCIYNIHPNLKKMANIDKNSADAFRKYIQTKGAQLSSTSEFIPFFALPFMKNPLEHNVLTHIFTKDWITKLKNKLAQLLQIQKSTLNQQNNQYSNTKKVSSLQQMFYNTTGSTLSRQECKENCSHALQNSSLKEQSNELKLVIQNLQTRFRQFTECSKVNLIESNGKWFYFARELFNVSKKIAREDKQKYLEKYERFFEGNINDHIQANQISLFDRNSYLGDDVSTPHLTKNKITKKQANPSYQIDIGRIKSLFMQANLVQKSSQICLVLKALKDRFIKLKNPFQRREIIVEYARTDILGIQEENYSLQKKLLLDSTPKVKQFYLRLMNSLTNDTIGLQYLTKSKKLIQNLLSIFNSQHQFSLYRKSVLGILQRFSYCKQPRLQLINNGIIPMIFRVFREEKEELSDFTIQYLTALMMNLSLKKQSLNDFQKYKTELIQILMSFIDCQNGQIRNFTNGTIFLLLTFKEIKQQALKQGLSEMIINLIKTREDDLCSQQYTYILKRLTGEEDPIQDEQSDEEEQAQAEIQQYQDDEQSLSDSSSDEYIDGQFQLADGEELLMKHYALLGPEAVRQQILTRSVLDETSKRINNMTTSINRSRRIDNIFAQRNNITAIEPELDSLLNRKK